MPISRPINQYRNPPLTIGIPSGHTRPLILELISKGQGAEVLTLLHSVNLKVVERSQRPGFKIFSFNNNKGRRFKK